MTYTSVTQNFEASENSGSFFIASIEAPFSLYEAIFDIFQYRNVRYSGVEYQRCNFDGCLLRTVLFGFAVGQVGPLARPTGELKCDWMRV